MDAPPTGDPRIHAKPIKRQRRDHHPAEPAAGRTAGVQADRPGRVAGETVEQKTHEGYDWVYVLSGRIRLVLGDQDFVADGG